MAEDSKTIGVAGLGLVGRGIAACCLARGCRVIAFTREDCPHEEAEAYIAQAMVDLVEKAGAAPELVHNWRERYRPVDSLADLAPSEFVIESVSEYEETKQEVFDQIEEVVGPMVPIGSCTSAIPITLMQESRRIAERFVGMHWSETGHATRFLEVIRGAQTNDETIAKTMRLAWQLGKEPSLVEKDLPGFIINRISYAMYREAAHILEEGVADMETIDRTCRNGLGLWTGFCGPFRWIDFTGGPELYARCLERVMPTMHNDGDTLPAPFARLKEEGAKGQPSGSGFYQYDESSPDWQERYHEYLWRMRGVLDEVDPLPPHGE